MSAPVKPEQLLHLSNDNHICPSEDFLRRCRIAHLTPQERRAFEAVAALNRFPKDQRQVAEFIRRSKQVVMAILAKDHPALRAVRDVIEGHVDLAVIGGAPTGKQRKAPSTVARPDDKDAASELFALGMTRAAGVLPMGLRQEQAGALVHQIVPQRGKEGTSTHGGRVRQALHTDNPGVPWPYRQQFLTLHGLVNPLDAPTAFLPLPDILAHLTARDIDRLRQPCVTFVMPESFALGQWGVKTPPQPVLRLEADGKPHIGFHTTAAAPVPGFEDTFDALMSAIQATEPVRLVVQPGDFLIWRDSRFLHGREAFAGERWVQRLYLRKSLATLRKACPGDQFIFDVRRLILDNAS